MPSASAKPLSALILGAPNPVSMGIARGWMMAGHKIAAVWYPERLAGTRGFVQDLELAARAPGVTMHGLAARAGVATRAVPRLAAWDGAAAEIAKLAPDVVLSVMFLDRIPPAVLDACPGRVFNLHPSLLPAYRGAAPILNMLWDRTIDRHSGMTLHVVAPEFDRGDILGQTPVAFPPDRNLTAYYMYLVKAGTALLTDCVPRFLDGALTPQPQTAEPAPQGTRKARDAVLSPAQSAADIAWLCATIPQMVPLRIAGAAPSLCVKRFIAVLGARTGVPPVLEGRFLHMDAQTERVQIEVVDAV